MRKAIIGIKGDVIGTVDVAAGVQKISIAGAVTSDGRPVNVMVYRVRSDKRYMPLPDELPAALPLREGSCVYRLTD